MTPAAAREALFLRALAADRLRVWLAAASFAAVSWERGEDGAMVARGPTPAEVDALERHAADLPRPEVESALAVLRDAVAYTAPEQPIAHRDVKPDNVG